jgi:ribose-phosphate pyrophosphokinase
MSEVFNIKAKHLTSNSLLAKYISKNIKNPVIIGPDAESYQWARNIAQSINVDAAILKKIRYSSRKVKVKLSKKIELKNKNLVIIDDIISTGHTILETIKDMKKLKPKNIYCICIHGVFVEGALEKIRKHAKVISCNTIPNKVSKIDVSSLIAEELV